jgi:hypothetical protein
MISFDMRCVTAGFNVAEHKHDGGHRPGLIAASKFRSSSRLDRLFLPRLPGPGFFNARRK